MIAVAGYINYADGVKKKNAAANKTKEVVGTDVDKDLKDVDIAERQYCVYIRKHLPIHCKCQT